MVRARGHGSPRPAVFGPLSIPSPGHPRNRDDGRPLPCGRRPAVVDGQATAGSHGAQASSPLGATALGSMETPGPKVVATVALEM